jgi:hypothetical protein
MTKLYLLAFVLVLVTFTYGAPTVCGNTGSLLSTPDSVEIEQQTCAGCSQARKELLAKRAIFCQVSCPNVKGIGCSNKSFLITLQKTGFFRAFIMENKFQQCLKKSAKINVKNCICSNLKLPLFGGALELEMGIQKACGCRRSVQNKRARKSFHQVKRLEKKAHTLEIKALELEVSATALESE